MLNFIFNFAAALFSRLPRFIQFNWIEYIIVEGCERYTPTNHRWRDEPMF